MNVFFSFYLRRKKRYIIVTDIIENCIDHSLNNKKNLRKLIGTMENKRASRGANLFCLSYLFIYLIISYMNHSFLKLKNCVNTGVPLQHTHSYYAKQSEFDYMDTDQMWSKSFKLLNMMSTTLILLLQITVQMNDTSQ